MEFLLPLLATAFILGLSSSTHCIVMCGGIATALSANNHASPQGSNFRLLCFHAGRILCYSTLGVIFGGLIQGSGQLLELQAESYNMLSAILRLFAAGLLILTALYLANLNHSIKRFEGLFSPLWRKISPLTTRYMAMNTKLDALKLGFLWGFLPCGMIYTALIWAISQQNSIWAGSLMLAFGLGTSPSLLLIQSFHLQVNKWLQKKYVKKLMALIILLMAVWSAIPAIEQLTQPQDGNGAHSHHHH
ncbi:MAG: sulfite exporter TauE/SafE family protein [Sinobacterium sp.]|nr:sulfite exporter TauE/SafE family protein [Sinobacterium sp.]